MLNKKISYPKLSLILLSIFCGLQLNAQSHPDDNIKFKLAQSYERSGDLETAAKLYEEAFTKESSNVVIFEALKRVYLQLKRYKDAIQLIEYRLQSNPNDIGLLAQLGSTFILNSNESKAIKIWDRAISIAPKNEMTYRTVGNAITQSRLFDRAIEIYKRGRIACNNPTLFTAEIANLYSATLNYSEATKEYLYLLRQNPSQLGLVQSYISQFTTHTDGLNASTEIVKEATEREPDNIQFYYLLAWLYMEGNDFKQAFSVYVLLDEKSKADGKEVFNFADHALREKAFTIAAEAFQYIAVKHPKFEAMPLVKFGYAQCLEGENEIVDTLKLFGDRNPLTSLPLVKLQEKFSKVLSAYETVINEFPNTEVAARSLYRIAAIKFDKLFDPSGAQLYLETIQSKYPKYRFLLIESQLKLADVYLTQGSIEKAKNNYKQIINSPQIQLDIRERAQFHLAEIDYFNLNFKDAITKLDELTSNPISDITNDALSLKIFIQENQKFEDALKNFALAEYLKKQLKFSDALEQFQSIVKNFPNTDVLDEAMIKIGDIQLQLERFPEALVAYNNLISNYPNSIFIDRTLMKIGQLYQYGLKDIPKAIETYEHLLEKFPNSIFAVEARKNIRKLRGDSI